MEPVTLLSLGTLILIAVGIYLAIMALLLPHYVYKIYKDVHEIRKKVCKDDEVAFQWKPYWSLKGEALKKPFKKKSSNLPNGYVKTGKFLNEK